MMMNNKKLELKDFSREELVNAIADWLDAEENIEEHLCDLVPDLRNGKWLQFHNKRLGYEN